MDGLVQAKVRRPGNLKLLKVLRALPCTVAMSSFVDPMNIWLLITCICRLK